MKKIGIVKVLEHVCKLMLYINIFLILDTIVKL